MGDKNKAGMYFNKKEYNPYNPFASIKVHRLILEFMLSPREFMEMPKDYINFPVIKDAVDRLSRIERFYGIRRKYEYFITFLGTKSDKVRLKCISQVIKFIYALEEIGKTKIKFKKEFLNKVKSQYSDAIRNRTVIFKRLDKAKVHRFEKTYESVVPLGSHINTVEDMVLMYFLHPRRFVKIDKNNINWDIVTRFYNTKGGRISNLKIKYDSFLRFCAYNSRKPRITISPTDFERVTKLMYETAMIVVPKKVSYIKKFLTTITERIVTMIYSIKQGNEITTFKGRNIEVKVEDSPLYEDIKTMRDIKDIILYFYTRPNAFVSMDKNKIPFHLLEDMKYNLWIPNEDKYYDELIRYDKFKELCGARTKKEFIEKIGWVDSFMKALIMEIPVPNSLKTTMYDIKSIEDVYQSALRNNKLGKPLK